MLLTNLQKRPALVAEQSEGWLGVRKVPQLRPSCSSQLLGTGYSAHRCRYTFVQIQFL